MSFELILPFLRPIEGLLRRRHQRDPAIPPIIVVKCDGKMHHEYRFVGAASS